MDGVLSDLNAQYVKRSAESGPPLLRRFAIVATVRRSHAARHAHAVLPQMCQSAG